MISSPLKWAGGKSHLIDWMRPVWQKHSHEKWVEIFAGGLSLPLGLEPKKVCASDINPHLINFWQWVQRNGVIDEKFVSGDRAFRNNKDYYLEMRQLFNSGTLSDDDAAQVFYYLNRNCFNGLCRFSKVGNFNVPFGRYTKVNYRTDFLDWKRAIASWDFKVADFRKAIDEAHPNSFIYADPPYHGTYSGYFGNFRWEDHVDLAKLLSRHNGPSVISNSYDPDILLLYVEHGYHIHMIEAPRSISANGNREPAKEVIATRNIQWD